MSAGALIAPFAFLGPRYDHVILSVFTSVRSEDIFHRRNVLIGLASAICYVFVYRYPSNSPGHASLPFPTCGIDGTDLGHSGKDEDQGRAAAIA